VAGDVIKFRTRTQIQVDDEQAYEGAAHAEAIAMLEEALEFVRNKQGGRVTGVAIALAFADRAYASHVPLHADNCGSLIAAIADCQYRMMKITNNE